MTGSNVIMYVVLKRILEYGMQLYLVNCNLVYAYFQTPYGFILVVRKVAQYDYLTELKNQHSLNGASQAGVCPNRLFSGMVLDTDVQHGGCKEDGQISKAGGDMFLAQNMTSTLVQV